MAQNVFPSLGKDDVTNIVLQAFSGTCASINSKLVLMILIASAELDLLFD